MMSETVPEAKQAVSERPGAAPAEAAPKGPAVVRVFPVRSRADVVIVRQQAQKMALDLGLGIRRSTELAIVVSELATNIVKYGVRGEMDLILDPGSQPRAELTVVARDVGPPIRDLELAMTDGYDDRGPIDPAALLSRGGLGTGLGAVARLADRFECQQDESGKAITVKFFR